MDQTPETTQWIDLHGYEGYGAIRSSSERKFSESFPNDASLFSKITGYIAFSIAIVSLISALIATIAAMWTNSFENFGDDFSNAFRLVLYGMVLSATFLIPRWYMQLRFRLTKSQAQYWRENQALRKAMQNRNKHVSLSEVIAAAEQADLKARPAYSRKRLFEYAQREAERSGTAATDLLQGALNQAVEEPQ